MNQDTYENMTHESYTLECVECYTCNKTFQINIENNCAWIQDKDQEMDFCCNECKDEYKKTLSDDEFLAIQAEGWA